MLRNYLRSHQQKNYGMSAAGIPEVAKFLWCDTKPEPCSGLMQMIFHGFGAEESMQSTWCVPAQTGQNPTPKMLQEFGVGGFSISAFAGLNDISLDLILVDLALWWWLQAVLMALENLIFLPSREYSAGNSRISTPKNRASLDNL